MRARVIDVRIIAATLFAAFAVVWPAFGAEDEGAEGPGISWQSWNDQTLSQARQSQRPIYLYLEAVWCHWCHVMQRETLSDPDVIAVLNRHFTPVRVDHDAHPGLADRYRAWGWPANIFLNGQGEEIALRAGYQAPDTFLPLLDAIVADPSPEAAASMSAPTAAGSTSLPERLREELQRRHVAAHDGRRGGLSGPHKYLDRNHVEYAMRLAAYGDDVAAHRARQTLDAATALLDPAWGGIYQYSTGGRWSNPHYEKLLRIQAAYLRIYALAALQWPQSNYAEIADRIHDYVTTWLAAGDGSYHNSQDADLVPGEKAHDYFVLDAPAREARGIPRISPARYVQSNARWLEALTHLYSLNRNPEILAQARALAAWLQRQRHDGLMSRGPDVTGQSPFLVDNLDSIRAFVAMYRVTGDRAALDMAIALAERTIPWFSHAPSGFRPQRDGVLELQPLLEDNMHAARVFNELYRHSGFAAHQQAAKHAMKYLSLESVALDRIEESGILLADRELSRPPPHLSIVAAENDQGRALFLQALATPGAYKRVEWHRRDAPPRLNDDIAYPDFARAAGYVCANGRCSLPAFSPEDYGRRIQALVFAGNGAK